MKKFADIYQLACLHKGSSTVVESNLPKARSADQLKAESDGFYLSNMSRRVFRAGLKHSLVDGKWPQFDGVFKQFDPFFCAMLSEDDIDIFLKDKRIIRHLGKLRSVPKNAQLVLDKSKEFGNFGAYLASWATDQTVDLWWELKKLGSNLGGNSGAAFMRMVEKDTFLITRDVVAVLMNEGVIDREPTSKKDMRRVQYAFSTWQQECGRDLCEISRIVSFTATT